MFVNNIFMNIVSMSLAASFCFAMILLMRKILDKKVDISKLSLLWILFIVSLIIPINFSSELSIKNYLELPSFETLDSFIEIEKKNTIISELEISASNPNNSNDTLNKLICITTYSIYFIVTSILLLKDIKIYKDIKMLKESNNDKRLEKILQIQKEKLHISKDIKILVQDKIKSPSLCGIIDSRILISPEIKQLSDEEIEMIFLHELIHYQKQHHVMYLFLKILENIHWFNPIIKNAGKFIREDIEYIVDKAVLNQNYDRVKYSKTILKAVDLEQFNRVNLLPGIYENKTSLERRIKKMKNNTVNTRHSLILIAVVAVIISTFTIVFASEKIDRTLESIIPENQIKGTESVAQFVYPLNEYEIANRFGERKHPITDEKIFHNGIDLRTNEGEEIYAVKEGIVIFADYDSTTGNTVKIKHKDGTISTYAHGLEILVALEEKAQAGQTIMLVGATGIATGPHLHFEMEDQNGNLINVNQLFE